MPYVQLTNKSVAFAAIRISQIGCKFVTTEIFIIEIL
jgi:hypothetical protein